MSINIGKGDRIRFRRFHAAPMGSFSLAGTQIKVTGDFVEYTGVVRHVRGDHPTNPTVIRLYIDPDGNVDLKRTQIERCVCGPHVEVRLSDVLEVLTGRAVDG